MAREFFLSMDEEEKNTANFTNDRSKFFNIYVFDLDGTLVNTLRSLQISTNIFLSELGLASVDDMDIFKYFVGNGTRVCVKKAYKHVTGIELSPEMVETYHERFREIFSEHCLDEIELYPGMRETLLALRDENSLIVCYTNKDDNLAKKCLAKLFPTDCNEIFSEIRGHIDGKEYKPDASFFAELREKYASNLTNFSDASLIARKNYTDDLIINLSGDVRGGKISAEYPGKNSLSSKKNLNFIMVGDSDVDIDTAINANVYSCACAWGFRPREELIKKEPDFLIDKPCELKKITIKELTD